MVILQWLCTLFAGQAGVVTDGLGIAGCGVPRRCRTGQRPLGADFPINPSQLGAISAASRFPRGRNKKNIAPLHEILNALRAASEALTRRHDPGLLRDRFSGVPAPTPQPANNQIKSRASPRADAAMAVLLPGGPTPNRLRREAHFVQCNVIVCI
jgi:hypothetical protein